MAKRKKFIYHPPSKKEIEKRGSQRGGKFDSPYPDGVTVFTPKPGDNRLRFLPPPTEEYDHHALDIFVHYQVGSDNQAYLCRQNHQQGPCPICQERKRAEASGDEDYAYKLRAVKRCMAWVIDRSREEEGPLLWPMAWTIDRDLNLISIDKASGEILAVADPEQGFDIEFNREGTGQRTRYTGIAISRRSTPLHRDEDKAENWLEYICDNELKNMLVFYDEDRITSVFGGESAEKEATPVVAEKKEQPPARVPLVQDSDAVDTDQPPAAEVAAAPSEDSRGDLRERLRQRLNKR